MTSTKTYPKNQVWAAACWAQRKNGTFITRRKEPVSLHEALRSPGSTPRPKSANKLTNLALMRIALNNGMVEVTEEDYQRGEVIRSYYCGWISMIFSGTARDFARAVVQVVSLEDIPDLGGELPMIASLPATYEKDRSRAKTRDYLDSLAAGSVPLRFPQTDPFGFNLTIRIVDCHEKERFSRSRYAVNAIVDYADGQYSMVYFFSPQKYISGQVYDIRASHGGQNLNDRVTPLAYVKPSSDDLSF